MEKINSVLITENALRSQLKLYGYSKVSSQIINKLKNQNTLYFSGEGITAVNIYSQSQDQYFKDECYVKGFFRIDKHQANKA